MALTFCPNDGSLLQSTNIMHLPIAPQVYLDTNLVHVAVDLGNRATQLWCPACNYKYEVKNKVGRLQIYSSASPRL